MNEYRPSALCDDATLEDLKHAMQADNSGALQRLNEACLAYPADPRLTLLRGSVHASLRDYPAARSDFTDTLAMAPELHVARFMLGYLELCSGHIARAVTVWAPLTDLEADLELRDYARGMIALAQDRFDDALAHFHASAATQTRHPDIARLIKAMEGDLIKQAAGASSSDSDSPHRLLSGYMTRH